MTSSKNRQLVVLGAVVAIAVAVLALVWITNSDDTGRLLDGTGIVLQGVSYGTNHSIPKAPLERLIERLPASWIRRMHWTASSGTPRTTTRPIFSFYLNFSSTAAATQSISYAIADEHGFESPFIFEGYYGSYTPGGFSNRRLGLVRGTGTFPHHSRTFDLCLYQQTENGRRVPVARFPIPNAAYQSASSSWQPQEFPSVYSTNGFTFSLRTILVGVKPPGPLEGRYAAQAGQWSEFRFRVTTNGSPAAGWSVNEMTIADAGVNHLRVSGEDFGSFNGQFSREEQDEIVCCHRWEFWSDEPAWKLRVHFEQADGNGYWIEYLVRPQFLSSQPGKER